MTIKKLKSIDIINVLSDLVSEKLETTVKLPSVEDLTYKQMKEILGCTDGNMTTHTKKLIQEGFMEVRKEFVNNRPQTTYHLTDEGRKQFEEYVALLNKLVEDGKNAQKV